MRFCPRLIPARSAVVPAVVAVLAAVLAGCGGGGTEVATDAASHVITSAVSRAGFAHVALQVPAVDRAYGPPHTMALPRGWKAEVWALVSGARLETWTPQGDLLVSQPTSGTITELMPRARRGEPPVGRTLVSGLTSPQGMAFDRLGGHEVLYVAESDQVDRYVWRGHGVGVRTVVIPNLPGDGAHPLKNVVVTPDHTVYVDIGSATKASPPGPRRRPARLGLRLRPGEQARPGIRDGDPQR